jgi:hypothetical protein
VHRVPVHGLPRWSLDLPGSAHEGGR